ncbi:GTP-binding protein YchF [Edhazardia aedis USNM 41457]|uniref:Obg-like ATPase homolog n=1 Tax=Edhazardia aedis (strain USNM 41457) TaxID=1003232 RepID=J9D7U5_EDHAE|nr:GTP-binding protein YchF [Edhazardia aedis USNM 41457]|eukprot:EJW03871.1 GTP-binding protein YchF [Edhazardia aedis USNM 41457]
MTEKLYFTRSGKSHNLSMGIVGLPNVGKSTLFNAITRQSVPAENYPFCTIDPSEGRLLIKDKRLDRLVSIYNPKNVVPAHLLVTDIAGLIKGASEGQGLGNAFLDHIRRTDGIFQVVRCFEDEDVVHCENSVCPLRDIKIINDELRFKDIEFISKKLEKYTKDSKAKGTEKQFQLEYKCLQTISDKLKSSWLSSEDFSNDEIKFINTMNLLTTKNVVYLANMSEDKFLKKSYGSKMKEMVLEMKKENAIVIPFSAEYELRMSLDGVYTPFMEKLVENGYKSLNLINFFTAGKDEVKSWTIRKNSKVTSAGGVIHSDFEDYFVMAEIMSYNDLNVLGSENEVKKAGKYLQRGKNYVVEDGDIIYFKSNPPKSGDKKAVKAKK